MLGPDSAQLETPLDNQSTALLNGMRRLLLGAGVVLTLVIGWYAAQLVMFNWLKPASLNSNLVSLSAPVHPEYPIQLSLQGYGTSLDEVKLLRSDPQQGDDQTIPSRTVNVGPGEWLVIANEGLRPDSAYRLVVDATAPRPSLPFPSSERLSQQYRFETVPTPHADLPVGIVQPRWGEAVPISWSQPVESVQVAVEPSASAEAWVDPDDATRTWVRLSPSAPAGQVYSIEFARVLGKGGMPLQQPASFQLAPPERPNFENAPTEAVMLKPGETFDLISSVPLTDIDVQTSGELQAKASLDGQHIRLSLGKYRQGAEALVTVAGATTLQGAPLEKPLKVVLRTPEAMEIPNFVPENKSQAVRLKARPYFEFESPPANPDLVRRSVTMTPAIKGEWSWLDDVTLVFMPADRLPAQTTINFTLHSGPDGPRTEEGGYLEKDVVNSFVTAANRRIEVSIGKQQLYMVENERVIRTVTVGTGVAGADTPPGEFEVLYKLPKTRMQGVNPSGARYDIPDVPWVLPFLGDYALHGVNWRNNFGSPASNGCVGMPVEDAKILYDWADVGTPVRIYK